MLGLKKKTKKFSDAKSIIEKTIKFIDTELNKLDSSVSKNAVLIKRIIGIRGLLDNVVGEFSALSFENLSLDEIEAVKNSIKRDLSLISSKKDAVKAFVSVVPKDAKKVFNSILKGLNAVSIKSLLD